MNDRQYRDGLLAVIMRAMAAERGWVAWIEPSFHLSGHYVVRGARAPSTYPCWDLNRAVVVAKGLLAARDPEALF